MHQFNAPTKYLPSVSNHRTAKRLTANVFPDRLSCRQVLNIMVILGFMLNYMLRMNLTIAIVSMVIPSNSSGQHSHSNGSALVPDECGVQATMMNDFNPIDDARTPAIDADVNRVNEMNNGSTLAAFPHWHRVR